MPAAKPEVMPAPKPANPAAAPLLAAPDPGARIEKLVGKQPETLAGYLQEGPPQLEEVIHAFVSSVQAIIAMHASGNKKEALTPQSICFDRLGKASVQTLQPALTRGTSSGAGNPRYAAPELFSEKSSGSDSAMAGAHVYALGIMFYEILLGQRLFQKTFAGQRTDLDWLRWQADLESRAPQVKSLLPDYPVALSDLVESMMEKRAEKRTTDLEGVLAKMRSIGQRANKTVVLGKAGAKQPALKSSSKVSTAPRKKGKTGWILLLILIVTLAGIGVFAWQNPDAFRSLIAPLLNLLNR
jgi:serine/threonine protein kinase